MGHKEQDKRKINIREEVFKFILQNQGGLNTIKEKLLKIVSSRTKINNAIEELLQSKRIIIKGKNIAINPNIIQEGTFFSQSGRKSIVIDGESKRYELNKNDNYNNFHSGEKVQIAFCVYGNSISPVIIDKVVKDKEKNENINVNEELIFGRVMKSDHDNLIFIPNDRRRFKHNIQIINDKKLQSAFQDKICKLRIVSEESNNQCAYGFIEEIVGEAGNPVSEYDAIAQSHGAIMSWSDYKLQKEIANAPAEVNLEGYNLIKEGEKQTNKTEKDTIYDLRNLMFTTTDPATCKDMDDAIYSTFDKNGNLVVYTAVANVTKYINLKSEIGKNYIRGAFTTYAPNKAYNILPPQYSTNICSLNPNVDRLALVVKTTIDSKSGKPIKNEIMDSVIQSKEKYSYEVAQDIVDKNQNVSLEYLKDKIKREEPLTKEEQVIMNFYASKIIDKNFKSREMIQFDTKNEFNVKFNEDLSDIVDITLEKDIPYHKVIENFMITANEATAEYALKNHVPNIFRVHDEPNEDKLIQADEFFNYIGIPFDGDLSPMGIRHIVASVKGTAQEKIVNEFLVRMQSKAQYSISPNPKEGGFISQRAQKRIASEKKRKNTKEFEIELESLDKFISHFGLQSEHYSHTTSPIRRLPDYITHYNILAHINGKDLLDESFVNDIANWANIMQDQNDLAEREFNELNSAIYCEHHIGDVMKGRICSFRRPENSNSIEDINVIIENEEKGIKVSIPLSEILSRSGKSKNVCISKYGSAIINKDNQKPVLTLCSEITFKITNANRITREVYGTIDLNKELENYESENNSIEYYGVERKISKRQRLIQDDTYEKEERKRIQQRSEEKHVKGEKIKKDIRKYENLEPEDAYDENRKDNIAYRKAKNGEGRKQKYFYDDENE